MQLTMASAGSVCMVPITVVNLAISDFIDRVFTLRTSARATMKTRPQVSRLDGTLNESSSLSRHVHLTRKGSRGGANKSQYETIKE